MTTNSPSASRKAAWLKSSLRWSLLGAYLGGYRFFIIDNENSRFHSSFPDEIDANDA